jgi:putative membrane protein
MPDPGRSPAGGCHLLERKPFYGDAMNPRFLVPPEGAEAHHHDPGWLHLLFALLIVAVLVVGAVIIVRMVLHHWTPSAWPRRHPAVDELDLRYARGEIDRAEYLQRRADLIDRTARGPALPPRPPGAPPGPPPPA